MRCLMAADDFGLTSRPCSISVNKPAIEASPRRFGTRPGQPCRLVRGNSPGWQTRHLAGGFVHRIQVANANGEQSLKRNLGVVKLELVLDPKRRAIGLLRDL